MESVLIAILLSGSVPVLHICIIHLINKPNMSVRIMFLCFLIYACLWGLASVYVVTLTASACIGGLSIIVLMCLGYMEVFSMICRGFSLRIITDIYLNGALYTDEVISQYGDGRGMAWMLKKRITSIEKLKLVSAHEQHLELKSPLGDWIGWGGIYFKKMLKMGKGG
jgi:hypothetical protein